MALRNKESIAGAVAREIDRIDLTGEHHGEGAAYKAAWDRAGSGYFKHCEMFRRDASRLHVYTEMCADFPHQPQRTLARVEGVRA